LPSPRRENSAGTDAALLLPQNLVKKGVTSIGLSRHSQLSSRFPSARISRIATKSPPLPFVVIHGPVVTFMFTSRHSRGEVLCAQRGQSFPQKNGLTRWEGSGGRKVNGQADEDPAEAGSGSAHSPTITKGACSSRKRSLQNTATFLATSRGTNTHLERSLSAIIGIGKPAQMLSEIEEPRRGSRSRCALPTGARFQETRRDVRDADRHLMPQSSRRASGATLGPGLRQNEVSTRCDPNLNVDLLT
jgi:hypothetical protein